MKTGIYQIRNTKNGKLYIGSSLSIKGISGRWSIHRSLLNRDIHPNQKLQNAWNKYGSAVFVFEVIEKCSRKKCLNREQHYLDLLLFASCDDTRFDKLGYNILRYAHASIGYRHTEASKKLMSKNRRGIKHTSKVRLLFSEQRRGEGNSHSKLTKYDIVKIRQLVSGGVPLQGVAKLYGVQKAAIWKIHHRKTWKHV